jgi:hypothetical protein
MSAIRNRARLSSTFSVLLAVVLALTALTALSACGTSSSSNSSASAQKLLDQTFTGSHPITSGVVQLSISLSPSGSSLLSGPISLSFGGPFQSRGSGQLPASDFTASVSALGEHGSLGIISTGSAGYVTLSGVGYRLPPASFKRLETGFAGLGGSGSASGAGGIAKLGIEPLTWLHDPTVIGTETVGGVQTTEIRAGVDVEKLLSNLSTLLSKASGIGIKGIGKLPTSISPASAAKLAGEVKHPTVEIWTANSDKTLRKLQVQLTLPLTGKLSSELGGVTSLGITLTLAYTQLGQPQAISAPTSIQPYPQLTKKLNALVSEVASLASLGAGSSSSSSSSAATASPGPSSSSSGSTAALGKYSQCIQAAGSDVAKVQKCSALLQGGG